MASRSGGGGIPLSNAIICSVAPAIATLFLATALCDTDDAKKKAEKSEARLAPSKL
jgi:hypothetical protein